VYFEKAVKAGDKEIFLPFQERLQKLENKEATAEEPKKKGRKKK
jgi:hypothetical protein